MLRGSVCVAVAWAATGCASAQVRWLAAGEHLVATGRVVEIDLPQPQSGPTAIALAVDGSVWFTASNANYVGRLNADGSGLVEHRLPTAGSSPRIIALGADGNLWFSEHLAGQIGRITPEGVITEFALPSATGSPTNVAVGPDRNVWYTKGATLGRVTPDGTITEFPLPPTARGVGLSAGSDRQPPARLTDRLWYADGGGNRIGYMSFE